MTSEWTMYAISKYFGNRHAESSRLMDLKVEGILKRARQRRQTTEARVMELEDDLARTLLLVQSLAEVCIAKGLLSRDDIAEMARQVDLSDGVEDGKLDPQTIRPEDARSPASSPEEYLRQLEDTPHARQGEEPPGQPSPGS